VQVEDEENLDEWLEAEKKQLDEMKKCNMHGEPILPPKNATIL
jgi:hypothetical protein